MKFETYCAIALLLCACSNDKNASIYDSAAGSVAASNNVRPTASDIASIDGPAPAYTTLSLDGDTVSLTALRGRVVLLNVWATWCSPCRAEIPELQALHEKYSSNGLELIGVSIDNEGTDDNVRRFAKNLRMTYPIWRDYGDGVSSTFRIVGVPATFLIDRGGVIRWKTIGPISPGDTSLNNALVRALGS